jgi:hypothetical protein
MLLSEPAAAEYLHVSRATFRRLRDRLTPVILYDGAIRRYRREDLDAIIQEIQREYQSGTGRDGDSLQEMQRERDSPKEGTPE